MLNTVFLFNYINSTYINVYIFLTFLKMLLQFFMITFLNPK